MITRRDAMVASLGGAAFVATACSGAEDAAQKTFVLVHGAWGGGWVWRRVVDLLERRGHKVFAPTLTGVGDRSHLLDPNVNLTTHVADVVNLIKWEQLSGIVLVGWSYGGMVITGVAEQIGPAIGSIVFLDAVVPENGQAMLDIVPFPPFVEAAGRGELAVAPFTAAQMAVNENDRAWVDGLMTPHPLASFTEKLTETGVRERMAKKTYIRATGFPGTEQTYQKYSATPGWRAYEVPCGHAVMVDMPERLSEILLEVA
jgi:pimeloyl-ACP methyl ester carboxylesterase